MDWILPLLILLPLLGGFAVLALPRGDAMMIRQFALWNTLVTFVLSVAVAWGFAFDQAGEFQMATTRAWVADFGVSFSIGVDSISLWLVLLTTFLMPITVLSTFNAVHTRLKEFYLWLLLLQAAMIGVFVARDLILFYVFFELTLIPLYFLIGIWGSGNRQWASKKFFIFTLTGSLVTFAGLLYVAWFHANLPGNDWTFDIAALTDSAVQMSVTQQGWVLLALMAGFAIKVPLFPVHTWLPLAHTEAPTAGSAILAGVLLKLGTYGMLRFALPMTPEAVLAYAPLIAVLAIIGIIYAALICWVQEDIKKLVAYSSISHLGFCVLGLFALNQAGVGGSVMYMINHGLSTGALFLCVGMIYERYHTREMSQYSGLGKILPVWSFFFVFFCLASVGLPGLNGFVGEFLTLLGAFTATEVLGPWYAVAAASGLILAAIYILYMVGRVVLGPAKEPPKYAGKVRDLDLREIGLLTPLAVGCLILGLYPTPVLRSLEPAIENTLAASAEAIEQRNADSMLTLDRPEEADPMPPADGRRLIDARPDAAAFKPTDRTEVSP